MSIVAETYSFVVGVDTHSESHCYAVINAQTSATVAGPTKFSTTPHGIDDAVKWCLKHTGQAPVLFAVEGSGSYGKQLCKHLRRQQLPVTEVRPPKRGGPKSDTLDAASAARSVQRVQVPKLIQLRSDGVREALAIKTTARRAMTKEVTANTQRLISLCRGTDLGIDAYQGLGLVKITAIASWRPHPSDPVQLRCARTEAIRLARRILDGKAELKANERELKDLVELMTPGMLGLYGVGPVSAAKILVVYSHFGRFATEAQFARAAGVAPIPAGSGKNDDNWRLDQGNNRQLNSAFYYIGTTRMKGYTKTITYVEDRTAEGLPKDHIRRLVERYALRDVFKFLQTLRIPENLMAS